MLDVIIKSKTDSQRMLSQTIMLYAFRLNSDVCQLHLNQSGKKWIKINHNTFLLKKSKIDK